MNHLFMGCEFFDSAWLLLRHWLGIHSVNPSYLFDNIVQFSALGGWSKNIKSLHIV